MMLNHILFIFWCEVAQLYSSTYFQIRYTLHKGKNKKGGKKNVRTTEYRKQYLIPATSI